MKCRAVRCGAVDTSNGEAALSRADRSQCCTISLSLTRSHAVRIISQESLIIHMWKMFIARQAGRQPVTPYPLIRPRPRLVGRRHLVGVRSTCTFSCSFSLSHIARHHFHRSVLTCTDVQVCTMQLLTFVSLLLLVYFSVDRETSVVWTHIKSVQSPDTAHKSQQRKICRRQIYNPKIW